MVDAGLFATDIWLLNERNGKAKKERIDGSLGEVVEEIINIFDDTCPTKIFFGETNIDEVIREEVTAAFNNIQSVVTILEDGTVKYNP